jgi:heme iron utilization protein
MSHSMKQEIQSLLQLQKSGILSTHSHSVPGYPFGSLIAYCLDKNGYPIIQLSALAEHTKNIIQNPKTSLIVVDIQSQDIQNSKRLTLLSDAIRVGPQDQEISSLYYSRFPRAREYGQMLDFSFYRLTPFKLRYVGGFGKAVSSDWADYF